LGIILHPVSTNEKINYFPHPLVSADFAEEMNINRNLPDYAFSNSGEAATKKICEPSGNGVNRLAGKVTGTSGHQ
jgi:hypothetical protein